MKRTLQFINICSYVFGERGHWEMGQFKMFQERHETFIIWETGHSLLWEKGHFILWKRENLSSGNDFILWESDQLSSGNWTTYPLGIGPVISWDLGYPLENGTWETGRAILWDSDHLYSGKTL